MLKIYFLLKIYIYLNNNKYKKSYIMTDINYFDGYNHNEMKKAIPISSLRIFDGEDLSKEIN